MMQLTVVGSSPPYPNPGEATTCYLVQSDHANLVVDCGHGAASALQKYVGAAQVSDLIITHFHPDHYADLFAFRNLLFLAGGRSRPTLWLPPCGAGFLDRLVRTMGLGEQYFAAYFNIVELTTGDRVAIADLSVTTVRTRHPVPTHGLRISDQTRAIGMTSDTGWSDHLVEFFGGVDLLLGECTYLEPPRTPPVWHLCAAEVGDLAMRSGAGDVVLTHYEERFGEQAVEAVRARGSFNRVVLGGVDRVTRL